MKHHEFGEVRKKTDMKQTGLPDAELWTRLVDLDVTSRTELICLEEGNDACFTNYMWRENKLLEDEQQKDQNTLLLYPQDEDSVQSIQLGFSNVASFMRLSILKGFLCH